MKTTVQLPDNILARAKQFASERKLTLRELIIRGLMMVLQDTKSVNQKFKLKNASVNGNGINLEFEAGWSLIRDAIYPNSKDIK